MLEPARSTHKIRALLAPCSLGAWPTPLELAPELAETVGARALWVKREDCSSPRCGGNKVRGLEFLLAGAPERTVFVTVGGTGSTHCLCTAVHARRLGHATALAQFAQVGTAASRAVADACVAHAALVVRTTSRVGLPVAVARAWHLARRFGRRRWIPGGGAHPRAVVGHLLAALELADQLLDPPDAIVTPVGTGGTAAGLALGAQWLGWPTCVVGVRVAPRIVANRWRMGRLARGAVRLLRGAGLEEAPASAAQPVLVIDGVGPGYGRPSLPAEAARRQAAAHGLALESTYGAKTFATLPALVAHGFRRIVFWHTFAPPDPLPEAMEHPP